MKPSKSSIITLMLLKKKRTGDKYNVIVSDRLSYFVMSLKYNEQDWITLRYKEGTIL